MQKLIRFCFIIISLVLCSPFAYANVTQDVQKVYYQWCHAIQKAKGNPAVVVKFYAPDAILLPTLSSDFLINKNGGLNAYFTKLTRYPDIRCTPEKLITHVHDNMATNNGFYRFTYKMAGKLNTLPARFTFVYKKEDSTWKIIVHHSSMMPQ